MTIKEALRELEAYPYSEAHYEVLKESFELDMMALYLEGYDFYKEAVDANNDIPKSVFDGYKNAAKADTSEKRISFVAKALKVLLTIFIAIRKPFWFAFSLLASIVAKIYELTLGKFFLNRTFKADIEKLNKRYMKDGQIDTSISKKILDEFKKEHPELYGKIMACRGSKVRIPQYAADMNKVYSRYLPVDEQSFLDGLARYYYGGLKIKVPKVLADFNEIIRRGKLDDITDKIRLNKLDLKDIDSLAQNLENPDSFEMVTFKDMANIRDNCKNFVNVIDAIIDNMKNAKENIDKSADVNEYMKTYYVNGLNDAVKKLMVISSKVPAAISTFTEEMKVVVVDFKATNKVFGELFC